MPLNIDKLMNALENENNEGIVELDIKQISAIKNDVLQQLPITKEELKKMNKQLKLYRFVDDISELNYGNYIRWIPLKNINIEEITKKTNSWDTHTQSELPPSIKLTNGGFICDIKVKDDGVVYIFCKNNMNRIFNIKLNEHIIFQKLTSQEQIILSAIKYLNN